MADTDSWDDRCPHCGAPTDKPGLCVSCEHAEDDARDADDSELRELYRDSDD